MQKVEFDSQSCLKEQIEADLGVKIPEFVPYPVRHPYFGTEYEVTCYDPDKKSFDLTAAIKNSWSKNKHSAWQNRINYLLLPDNQTLARRERTDPLRIPASRKVKIQYLDRNFNVEYSLAQEVLEKNPNGTIKYASTRSFHASVYYEPDSNKPALGYLWDNDLRRELTRVYLDKPGECRVVNLADKANIYEFKINPPDPENLDFAGLLDMANEEQWYQLRESCPLAVEILGINLT
ncbi:MAG: hypothetical protein Q7R49_03415 [Candidatus Daviesbacteria bacterium]|nr:hypothetical protein [Candidatus Daviesbacteria bacterium]